ncbi:MAG: GGDEF domain-containing protein [Oscillospiraceae bacterium]|nr:GGDEF domain-containing protein [Oscillospiraceae bacterium]
MNKISLKNFTKEEQISFFQSKYEYYKLFNTRMITVSVLAYLSFFVTDCNIFGHFAFETLLSRAIVIIPCAIYLVLSKKVTDYRVMVPATYLMIHIIIWCTDWATYLLPDRQFAIPGMIIMNLIFVCAGFSAPFRYSMPAHIFLVVDIAVANIFIQYADIQMMYLFNIPCIVAVGAMHHMMQNVYFEHYFAKDQLKQLAVHDQLTEVYNRNKLKELVDAETGELTKFQGLNVSFLLIDIDFFKKVNDEFGHESGDKVLVWLADILKSAVRETDYVIRWGGEEFLIIMPGCTAENASRIAEKIREKVETSNNSVCKSTISIGVSQYTGGEYSAAVRNADDALYEAKNSGRNKVVVYGTSL